MKWYQWLWKTLIAPVKFIAQLFTEADGNGGKASFSRVLGTYVVFKIIYLTEIAPIADRANAVSEQLMTLFWVLIGYQIISKILSSLSPAVLDIVRAMLLKVGAKVNVTQS